MKKRLFELLILIVFPFFVLPQGSNEKEDLMNGLFERAYEQIYIHKDSAFSNFEKALLISTEIEDLNTSLDILDHIIITADQYSDFPRFYKALRQMDSIFKIEGVEQKLTDIEERKINAIFGSADYHFEIQEYVRAKELYLQVLRYYDNILPEERSSDQSATLYTLYSSLGTTYMYLDKFELSELYYQRGIKLIRSSSVFEPYEDAYYNFSKQSMAQLYTRMGKHQEATEFNKENLKLTKKYYQQDKRYRNNLVSAFQKITISYIAQDSLQRALETLDESLPYLPEKDPFHKEALLLYGDIYLGLGIDSMALANYRKALVIFQSYSQNKKHRDLVTIYSKIAIYYLKQGEYIRGLQTVTEAFNVSGANVNITRLNENPNPEEVFSRTQLLLLLDIKLQLLQGSFEETFDKKYLDAALQASQDILKTFDYLKNEFDSKLDKQFLAEKAYPIFHLMMGIAYTAYEINCYPKTLQLALNIAEKNKDFVLLEALRSTQATQYGDVPKSVLEKEAQLRAQITNLEKQLFDDTENDNGYSDALFKRKQEYFSFLDTLKTKYPKYHELKYQNRTLDLEMVRKKILNRNGTLISYTMTDANLYAITINNAKENFLKLPFADSDRESIRDFYRLLSRSSVEKDVQDKISELGQTLYAKILQQPLEGFDTKNLTIIPDGELHYLPIDLLQENSNYLLETRSISYGNSVASLLELKEKRRSETNKILAFAPSFSGDIIENSDRQFGKLLYNDDEVHEIGMFYDAKTLLEKEATLGNFRSNASEFNIFHFATHASANDEYPDYSYLAFTEAADSTESNILYIKDLYNTTLNADMVTLSACQTGIGKLRQGQGMLSLSKGFYYAGAKSLVNTLWKINDKSTVKLMEYFYEELSKGFSKSEALRKAKLKYLETTDDELLKHPYYWAAFVVSGNVEPLQHSNVIWWWALLAIPIFAFFLYLKKRKSI